jgi:hypothetical protein
MFIANSYITYLRLESIILPFRDKPTAVCEDELTFSKVMKQRVESVAGTALVKRF